MTTPATGSTIVADHLAAEGVDTVFTIPGVHNVHLCDALLDQPGMSVVTGRHEQDLAFMANGYTRSTGRIAVPLVISGPGVTNALTGLADAYLDSVPMVLLAAACDTDTLGRGAFHELRDQSAALASVCSWTTRVESVDEIPGALRAAFHHARHGRPGPTAVEIPMGVQSTTTAPVAAVPSDPPARPPADAEAVARAAALLTVSRRPILYVGSGAMHAGDRLAAVAERLGAPVVTSALAKGAIPEDHPLCLGTGVRRRPVATVISEADAVLVVGSSLDEANLDGWRLRLPGTVVQVDIAPEVLGRTVPVTVGLVGDATVVLDQLLAALGTRAGSSGWAPGRVAGLLDDEDRELVDDPGRRWMSAIQAALDPETFVTNDAATVNAWALHHLRRTRPRTMTITSNLGALGFALPAAVGAKVADPDRRVLALVGDGGFLFSSQVLATAVQHRLGVVAVVFDDGCYSSIKRQQVDLFGRAVATDLHNPDFALLAGAYGAHGAVATTPDQLTEAVGAAWDRDRPTVVVVPI